MLGVDLVATLKQHVKLGRERDEYAVECVVGFDLEQHRAAQHCVARVHEPRISVDALIGLPVLFVDSKFGLLLLRLLLGAARRTHRRKVFVCVQISVQNEIYLFAN